MNRNRIRICGRKTTTLPTPEITPFWMKLWMSPLGSRSCASPPQASKPAWSRFMSGCAQLNTAWNITNRMASSSTSPKTGCSRTASTLLVSVSGRLGALTQAAMMRSASRWSARTSAAPGGVQLGDGILLRPRATIVSISARSSRVPPVRIATAGTTGMPSSAESCATSMSMPRWRARSNMLSTSTIGRPTRLSSSARRMVRRMLVASATHRITFGGRSFSMRPSTMSRVIASSGLRPRSE